LIELRVSSGVTASPVDPSFCVRVREHRVLAADVGMPRWPRRTTEPERRFTNVSVIGTAGLPSPCHAPRRVERGLVERFTRVRRVIWVAAAITELRRAFGRVAERNRRARTRTSPRTEDSRCRCCRRVQRRPGEIAPDLAVHQSPTSPPTSPPAPALGSCLSPRYRSCCCRFPRPVDRLCLSISRTTFGPCSCLLCRVNASAISTIEFADHRRAGCRSAISRRRRVRPAPEAAGVPLGGGYPEEDAAGTRGRRARAPPSDASPCVCAGTPGIDTTARSRRSLSFTKNGADQVVDRQSGPRDERRSGRPAQPAHGRFGKRHPSMGGRWPQRASVIQQGADETVRLCVGGLGVDTADLASPRVPPR